MTRHRSSLAARERRPSAAAPVRTPAQGLLARTALLASYPGKLARGAYEDRASVLLRPTRVLAVRALRAGTSPAGGRGALFLTFAPRSGEIGQTLVQCLEMGRLRQESLGYRAAVSRSAAALEQLAAVAWARDVAEVVRVAQARVKGTPWRREDARDAKRAAMAKRG